MKMKSHLEQLVLEYTGVITMQKTTYESRKTSATRILAKGSELSEHKRMPAVLRAKQYANTDVPAVG
jgi:hypothetical protein